MGAVGCGWCSVRATVVVSEAGDGAKPLERALAEMRSCRAAGQPRIPGKAPRATPAGAPMRTLMLLVDMGSTSSRRHGGHTGYVLKSAAIRLVVGLPRREGGRILYPGGDRPYRDYLDRRVGRSVVAIDPLTPRELEIGSWWGGAHHRRIADTLVSEKTLEHHRSHILEKLGMRDRVELTRYAIRRGLVEP